jgi:uncharacterized protein (TIGR03085 family)
MATTTLDAAERSALCDLFEELGPDAPTLLDGWTAHDLAAHLVLREHDLLAAPCLVLPGPFARFAERRRVRLARTHDFAWLVERIRSGPPPGFFRIPWVRTFPNLNEYFVHHEDVRRADGRVPRQLAPDLERALWRNVERGGRYLTRRLRSVGLDLHWAGSDHHRRVRHRIQTVRISGAPGELLLHLFGRAAVVDLDGPPDAVDVVRRTRFGM